MGTINQDVGNRMYDVMTCCQTKPGGCLLNEGDCDADYECAEGLRCGNRNCNWFNFDLWNIPLDAVVPHWMTPDCCEGNFQCYCFRQNSI